MSLSRHWPGWIVLLCAGLATAADAASLAAEAQPAPPPAAPAARKAKPSPPKKKAVGGPSLLQALGKALAGDGEPDVARAAPQAADDANIRNLEAQFRPQFQQLLYVELAFLRRVCKVDAKQFADVAKAAKAGLHVAVREYVVSQYATMRRRNDGASDAVDPRSLVQRLLAPLVESKIGQEQAQRYRQECGKRAESRKRAVVLNLVAALDERLVLTAEQREKLVQSLSSDYQNGWDQYLQVFAFDMQYLPAIRDPLIVPLLNERQQSVWRQAPKQNVGGFWGIQFIDRGNMLGEATEVQEIARIVEEVQDERSSK